MTQLLTKGDTLDPWAFAFELLGQIACLDICNSGHTLVSICILARRYLPVQVYSSSTPSSSLFYSFLSRLVLVSCPFSRSLRVM